VVPKLIQFIAAYNSALTRLLTGRDRSSLPFHGDSSRYVAVFDATDGYPASAK